MSPLDQLNWIQQHINNTIYCIIIESADISECVSLFKHQVVCNFQIMVSLTGSNH